MIAIIEDDRNTQSPTQSTRLKAAIPSVSAYLYRYRKSNTSHAPRLMVGQPRLASESESQAPLPGYEVGDNAIRYSQEKLAAALTNLQPFVKNCSIGSFPCVKEEDTVGYRCKCSFQVIFDGTQYQYAMRQHGQPVALSPPVFFPIANRRIQSAMNELWEKVMNGPGRLRFPHLVNNSLASITFAASWNDDPSGRIQLQRQDCIVTVNCDAAIENEDLWLEEARQVCRELSFTQLHGRSRKQLVSAIDVGQEPALGSYLRDTVYLWPPSAAGRGTWQVNLQKHATTENQRSASVQSIPVHYHKPEAAFFHPNARVMCQALQWMLDRIFTIAVGAAALSPPCSLLEMYCGCGAHTLALAKSGMLASIQAVELDQRLVDACTVNIDLNREENDTPIHVVRGDAGQWARNQRRKKGRDQDYNILLVDPPRQGLDAQVIDLAIHTESFQHVLIISCGHEALVRDLKLLCDHFEIVDCRQLDLFPRTDSVETLVHLQRNEEHARAEK